MKVTAPTFTSEAIAEKSAFAVFSELVKARLTVLVLLTTLVGFSAASRWTVDYWKMFHALAGTAFLAAGAAALNQLLERRWDALMLRTQERPLPSGRLQPDTVLIFGGLCSAAGLAYLALAVNPITAFLGAATLISYLFVYTPLKRFTPLNTVVGAVSGALPPLMGWTAARGEITVGGWSLFALQFFWQLPHFLAIAWLYREDYARAGFKMLPFFDPTGHRTGLHVVNHSLGLLTVSLAPFVCGVAGPAYLRGALVLGVGFLVMAILFARSLTQSDARRLFFASIIYLPLVLGLLVWDKAR